MTSKLADTSRNLRAGIMASAVVLAFAAAGTTAVAQSSPIYVGNSLTVANGNADGAAPLVILGEYGTSGPLATATTATTFASAGTINNVQFYGGNYDFTVYDLSLVSSGTNTQTFVVDASETFSGSAAVGAHTLAASNFIVDAGSLLAFAGTGPYYPQTANDANFSDATYENSSNPNSFVATPPGGAGTSFTVGSNPNPATNYEYISNAFDNQGRTYAFGVDYTPFGPRTVSFDNTNAGQTGLSWSNNQSQSNWLSGGSPTTPQAGDAVQLVSTTASTQTSMSFDGSLPSSSPLASLTVDATGTGSTMELDLNTSSPFSATAETVGQNGSGSIVQSNGTNTTTTLTLAANAGSTGTYDLQSGTLTAGTIQVNTGGTFVFGGGTPVYTNFNLAGGSVTAATSTPIELGGGTFTQTGSTSTVTGTTGLYVTDLVNASYLQEAGTLNAGEERIGYNYVAGTPGGQGSFTQSGGTNTVGNLAIGFNSLDNGAYTLQTGAQLSANTEIVGDLGTGLLTQTGGSNSIAINLIVGGDGASANGTYLLGGGTLSAPNEIVANLGQGTFTQSGTSVNNVAGTLTLAEQSGATGAYNLQGGTLTAGTVQINAGGTFQFAGGQLNTSNFVLNGGAIQGTLPSIGTTADAGNFLLFDGIQTFTQQSGNFTPAGGSVTVTNGGTYDLQSGTLTAGTIQVNTGGTFVFGGGTPVYTNFNLAGGSVTAATSTPIELGGGTFTQTGSTSTVTGTTGLYVTDLVNASYLQEAGTLNAGEERIGYNYVAGTPGGQGSFTQSGGTNTVGNLAIGFNSLDNGAYTLQTGAQLSANTEIVGDLGTGLLTQTGGSNSIAINLIVGGDGASANGTYLLGGGTLSAPNEIVANLGQGTFTQSGTSVNNVAGTLTLAEQSGATGAYNLQGGALTAGTVQVNAGGTFQFAGGQLNTSNFVLNGGAIQGTLPSIGTTADAGNFLLFDGIQTFTQQSGNFTPAGGSVTVTNGGTYDLQSGTLTAGTIQVNTGGTFVFGGGTPVYTNFNLAGGSVTAATSTPIELGGGTFTQTGSTSTVTGTTGLYVTDLVNASYLQEAGTLNAGEERIGYNYVAGTPGGQGSFTQSGGTNTVGNLAIGFNSLDNGAYTLQTGAQLSANTEIVGDLGTGLLTQTGGSNSIAINLIVGGDGASANGTYLLGGGTLSAPNEIVANLGQGTFTQSGTSVNNVAGTLTLAEQSGATAAYNLQGGTLTAGTIQINAGGTFTQTGGTATVSGNATNAGTMVINGSTFMTQGTFTNTNNLTVSNGGVLNAGSIVLNGGHVFLANGTIDPASIAINGGTFGGTGTVVGNVAVNGAAVNVGGPAPGILHVEGNYSQSGGSITFDIGPNGLSGFLVSTLVFDQGSLLSIGSTNIVLNFLSGADPTTFASDGLLNLDSLFTVSNGDGFGADFNFSSVFQGDTFSTNLPGEGIAVFDPSTGALDLVNSPVPELGSTLVFLLIGLAALTWMFHKRAIGEPVLKSGGHRVFRVRLF